MTEPRQVIRELTYKDRRRLKIKRIEPQHTWEKFTSDLAWCQKCGKIKQGDVIMSPTGRGLQITGCFPSEEEAEFPDTSPEVREYLRSLPDGFLEAMRAGSDQTGGWSAGNYLWHALDHDEDEDDKMYAPPKEVDDRHHDGAPEQQKDGELWDTPAACPALGLTDSGRSWAICDCGWRYREMSRVLLAAGVTPEFTSEK